jgi:methionyl-tRNA formyltransferase
VLLQRELPIAAGDDLRDYFPDVTERVCRALVDVADDFAAHWHAAAPQPRRDVHFRDDEQHAPLLGRDCGRLDWARPALGVHNTWRAFVGTPRSVFATFVKAATPAGATIASDAKRAPCRVVVNEAFRGGVAPGVWAELATVGGAAPGAVYVCRADRDVVAVRCGDGWFLPATVTLHGGKPQGMANLARAMRLRPGQLFPGVFATPPAI